MNATTAPTTLIITARSRNLGYGWTTTVAAPVKPDAYPRVAETTTPTVTGSLLAIEAEMARQHKITSGGTWTTNALFVAGRRVISATIAEQGQGDWSMIIDPTSPSHLAGQIIHALRQGCKVRVTLAEEGE